MSQPLTIVHSPFGTDHPYLAGAEERTPRDPAGGVMVSGGFLTTPGGSALGGRREWNSNRRPEKPLPLGLPSKPEELHGAQFRTRLTVTPAWYARRAVNREWLCGETVVNLERVFS